MRIGIVAFPFDKGKSGVWNYIANIVKNVVEQDKVNEYIIFTPYDFEFKNNNVREILFHKKYVNDPILNILWHQTYIPWAVKKFKIDILHLPAGNRRLTLIKPSKTIVTVHDLAQFHVDEKYDIFRMFYVKKILPLFMRGIDKVVAVSESTKNDILHYWDIKDVDITILPNGVTKNFSVRNIDAVRQKEVLKKHRIEGRYLFYVSRLEHPGKNHIMLIRAFEKIKNELKLPHKLVLAGSRWRGAEKIYERAKASSFKNDIIFTGYVGEEDLPYLYKGADVFVFPSLYEGFGVPILEAMACGTPIVASNISSMPEVLGDCGLTFDPADLNDMAEKIQTMLTDQALKNNFIARGLERAKLFDWGRIARDMVKLYKAMGSYK